jgi:hypothetical protein
MKEFNPEKIVLPEHLQRRQFFHLEEFGKLIGVTANTVSRWGKLGFLKITKFSPRCQMVSISELERFKRGEMMEGSKNNN